MRDQITRLAGERGFKNAARVAARLSDTALATLVDWKRLEKVFDRTGYGELKDRLGPRADKVAPIDLLLLGLAALARSDEEVGRALHKISPHSGSDVAASRIPLGFVPVTAAIASPPIFSVVK